MPNSPADMANNAVIVKMTRVIMIAPMLIILGIYLSYSAKGATGQGSTGGVKLVIPWFLSILLLLLGSTLYT